MEKVQQLIEESKVRNRVSELALDISKHLDKITVICVLKGAIVFCSDLIRELSRNNVKVELDFARAKSYRGTESTGKVEIEFHGDVTGKNILLVDDIIDTGRTIKILKEYFIQNNAGSVKVCSLLDKPSRRVVNISADFTGFKVPDTFVVGYGIDYNEHYRELPYIGELILD